MQNIYALSRLYRDLLDNGLDESTKQAFDTALLERGFTPDQVLTFLESFEDQIYNETNVQKYVDLVSYFMYDIAENFSDHIVETYVVDRHTFLDKIHQYACIQTAVQKICRNRHNLKNSDIAYMNEYIDIYILSASYCELNIVSHIPTLLSYEFCAYTQDKLRINKFDIDNMNKDPLIFIFGGDRSEKYWLSRDILTKFDDEAHKTILVRSYMDKLSFENIDQLQNYSVSEYCDKDFANIITTVSKLHRRTKRKSVLVMDDCANFKNDAMQTIMLNGKSWGTSRVLMMSEPAKIAPIFRYNVDYVFLLKIHSVEDLCDIYNYYASMFPTFKAFQKMYNAFTSDCGCMVIKNVSRGDIAQKVCWYRYPHKNNSSVQ